MRNYHCMATNGQSLNGMMTEDGSLSLPMSLWSTPTIREQPYLGENFAILPRTNEAPSNISATRRLNDAARPIAAAGRRWLTLRTGAASNGNATRLAGGTLCGLGERRDQNGNENDQATHHAASSDKLSRSI